MLEDNFATIKSERVKSYQGIKDQIRYRNLAFEPVKMLRCQPGLRGENSEKNRATFSLFVYFCIENDFIETSD